MTIHKRLVEIDGVLRKGHLEKTQAYLAELDPITTSDKIYHRHLNGKLYFMKGQYQEARTIYEEITSKYGNHLGPLCDLTFTLMLMGEYSEAKRWFEIVKEHYQKEKEALNLEISVRTLLFLAKLSFEWMEFHECLTYLKEIISLPQKNSGLNTPIDSYWIDLALVNKFKVSAFLNLKSAEWHDLYGTVSLMTHNQPRFRYEQHHALLLADARLHGISRSKIRVLNFINEGIFAEDVTLGISDLIEIMLIDGCLAAGRLKHEQLFAVYIKTPPRDSFDRVLNYILLADKIDESLIWKCTKEASSDNPLTQYRILFILKHLSQDSLIQDELNNRLSLLLLTLSEKNQSHLKGRLIPQHKPNDQQPVTIKVLERNRIKINSVSVAVPKHPLYKILFSHFQNENILLLAEVTLKTWNTEYVTSDYQRIWAAIKRLNKELLPFTHGKNVFAVKKDGIYLSEECVLLKESSLGTTA